MIRSISLDDFLQRVGSQPNGNVWSAIVVSSSYLSEVIEDLKETIGIFTECEIGVISGKNGATNLIISVENTAEDYLVLYDLESWNRDNWREFDYARSRLAKKRGGVLVLASESIESLSRFAPNFASWLGSRIYLFDRGRELLTADERQERLLALQEYLGLSNSEVIELAKAHKLPSDPEYGEWLILLNREDLIER
ncbi:MAG TPA: ABC transporter permease [Cyanobacteria bacterium UBA11149]|nr:ABC transporter permease [Cyanobacteria bacterium UBA11367]HBE58050.1 ABC transporter permease [Cyanobacteria bacterium UBA11366]HBK66243.1 ABC transporter permease [Cyanobacteria bacterium UBA11166]HBR75351.1 ABC transporter permease [Cyanobacteria bacterium UBA11159]HBS71934.1 ABC transporter permease [Cyanobacteria bacterium UBA11153]HBW90526.1 ABC transporter permease [Cyanobacteria bacterium UBA11149]HCA93916.1 ABC transporter permease [Cyanobacteria bacterium UBA9226]